LVLPAKEKMVVVAYRRHPCRRHLPAGRPAD